MEDPKNQYYENQDPFADRQPSDPADALITVQIPESEIYDSPPEYEAGDGPISHEGRRPSWFARHASRSKGKDKTVGVRMRKGEFFSYFVKDQKTGRYREGVVEPPTGRKAWLQQRLQDQQSWPPAQFSKTAGGKLDSNTLAPTKGGPKGGIRGFARSAIDCASMNEAGIYLRPHDHHERGI